MPREHGDRGRYVETTTHEDVLTVFEQVDGPVVISGDVADALGCSSETARRKLLELNREGVLERRETSRTILYWRATRDDAADLDGNEG